MEPGPCIGSVVFATGPSGKFHISFLHDSKKLETSQKSNNLRTDKHNNGIIEYYLPNERDKLLHSTMKLINIRLSERSHRQKRNAVIILCVWNSKPGKVICSEGNRTLSWGRMIGMSMKELFGGDWAVQYAFVKTHWNLYSEMGMFIYYILVLFLASLWS